MNGKDVTDAIIHAALEQQIFTKQLSVYLEDDLGRIVPAGSTEIIHMRDGGEAVPVLVIKR